MFTEFLHVVQNYSAKQGNVILMNAAGPLLARSSAIPSAEVQHDIFDAGTVVEGMHFWIRRRI